MPIAKIVPGNSNHNIEFDLKVAITAKGGIVNFAGNVAMKATGKTQLLIVYYQ